MAGFPIGFAADGWLPWISNPVVVYELPLPLSVRTCKVEDMPIDGVHIQGKKVSGRRSGAQGLCHGSRDPRSQVEETRLHLDETGPEIKMNARAGDDGNVALRYIYAFLGVRHATPGNNPCSS